MGRVDKLVPLSLRAGTTVRRLDIPLLPISRAILGKNLVYLLKGGIPVVRRRIVEVALVTLVAKHWSLAWGQASSPPLQRDRVQLSARPVAQLNIWPVLCRKAARLQSPGGVLPPRLWAIEA